MIPRFVVCSAKVRIIFELARVFAKYFPNSVIFMPQRAAQEGRKVEMIKAKALINNKLSTGGVGAFYINSALPYFESTIKHY